MGTSVRKRSVSTSKKAKGHVSGSMSVTFLGGLSKIGRNCMVLESNVRLFVIDCVLMFPVIDIPGIDFIFLVLHFSFELIY